jgi:hypothetical protein
MLLIETIFDWKNTAKAYKKGWNAAEPTQTETRK